ncbi:MAG: translation initiation factor IF-2 [Clostridiales bacterium]|nr:translation initiation factor IF-2 [Clostridiales bacterium]
MNKTENKTQLDFSNIRDLQNIIKSNGISKLAMGVKSFRQRLASVGEKITNAKKASAVKVAPAPVVAAPKVEAKPVVAKTEAPAVKPQAENYQDRGDRTAVRKQGFDNRNGYNGNGQGYQGRQGGNFANGQRPAGQGFGNRPQNGGFGNRQGGKFVATGERRFDNNNDNKRPGAFSNGQNGRFGKPGDRPMGGPNGQRKPFGAAGAGTGPRLARPTETFDASTLAKNNTHSAPKKKSHDKGEEKKSLNKKSLLMRGYVSDEGSMDEDGVVKVYSSSKKAKEEQVVQKVVKKIEHAVITTDNLTVKILAEAIGKSVPELMGKFLLLGMMVNINSNIDFESAELVAGEFGITLEKKVEKSFEEKLADSYANIVDEDKDLVKRPAVVCVMGHVDHGKTSLLDSIRKTNIVAGEAGGITQSIGAYTIKLNGEDITFIDTPGHEAFTAMRERGAKLTDIAILIVAADDGVMPQTVESIKQIKNAKVPMIVAISKIDKPGANIDNVKTQLAQYDVLPEEWGGDAIIVPIDAKHGTHVDKLLEMVLFVAEYENLRANPNRKASGSIIEAKLDRGLGAVATVLVQNGTLHVGDYVVVGTCTGKIRAMMNDKNERIKSAGPSIAVQINGLSGVPNAGDELFVVDEKMSRQVALERQNQARVNMIKGADLSIENMMNKIADSNFKDYNVIVKADVQGSVEALKQSLLTLQNEEVKVRFVSGGVGAINENDVNLAQASNALIVAFNTNTDFKAKVMADKYKVEIKNSRIIYEVLDYITEKINKMVTPKYKEVITGHAEIRATFKASKVGLIAGTYVKDGRISRGNKARVYRDDKLIFEGEIGTIQREKNEAKDVDAGFECGVTFAGFTNFAVGDTFETYTLERIN